MSTAYPIRPFSFPYGAVGVDGFDHSHFCFYLATHFFICPSIQRAVQNRERLIKISGSDSSMILTLPSQAPDHMRFTIYFFYAPKIDTLNTLIRAVNQYRLRYSLYLAVI